MQLNGIRSWDISTKSFFPSHRDRYRHILEIEIYCIFVNTSHFDPRRNSLTVFLQRVHLYPYYCIHSGSLLRSIINQYAYSAFIVIVSS